MKQNNRIFIVLFTLLFLITNFSFVIAEDSDTSEPANHFLDDELIEELSLNDIQLYWHDIVNNYGGYIPELKKSNFTEMIKNNGKLSFKSIIFGLINFLFFELIINGKLLGLLLMLTLFSVILQTMHSAFEGSAISKIAYFVVYIVLIYIVMNSFFIAFTYTKDTIDMMSGFMIALIPLVLGLLAAFGNILTVSFFHPIIIFLINVSGLVISKFILPLLFLAALLLIASSINENIQVTHLANLFKTISIGTLGSFFEIFLGVMSVQGTVSAIQDGVAMKTTKFITGNFIPVIGRTLTDATDTILSASLLLKNAIGIVGLLIIAFIALFPALKIFAIALIYKIAAAVLQPLGDGPIIDSLNTISQFIGYILACLLTVTMMFFLTIVIIIAASNVTLLLR